MMGTMGCSPDGLALGFQVGYVAGFVAEPRGFAEPDAVDDAGMNELVVN